MSFLSYFSSLGGLSALNVILSEWLVKTLKVEKSWVKQLISWGVAIVLCVIGFLIGLGLFSGYGAITAWTGWVCTIMTGVGVGLISNGLYDIDGVKKFLDWFANWIKQFGAKKEQPQQISMTEAANAAKHAMLHEGCSEGEGISGTLTGSIVDNTEKESKQTDLEIHSLYNTLGVGEVKKEKTQTKQKTSKPASKKK